MKASLETTPLLITDEKCVSESEYLLKLHAENQVLKQRLEPVITNLLDKQSEEGYTKTDGIETSDKDSKDQTGN